MQSAFSIGITIIGTLTALPLASTYNLISLLPGIVDMPINADATASAILDVLPVRFSTRQPNQPNHCFRRSLACRGAFALW